jgi:hypothetical protein
MIGGEEEYRRTEDRNALLIMMAYLRDCERTDGGEMESGRPEGGPSTSRAAQEG